MTIEKVGVKGAAAISAEFMCSVLKICDELGIPQKERGHITTVAEAARMDGFSIQEVRRILEKGAFDSQTGAPPADFESRLPTQQEINEADARLGNGMLRILRQCFTPQIA